jgi:hypothetical protein
MSSNGVYWSLVPNRVPHTDTMDIWFYDPGDEYISEEAGEGINSSKE